uniref:Transmembrane protein 213 n=1 Tax=Pyxicephalus adspersus TaxID=30357 RepID=A0AAV3AU43_PYXAD|nr:TPA: hypothetical protein GDO54_006275 [Pyxicephalus adspersus]
MDRELCVCLLLLLCYIQLGHTETNICDLASRCCVSGMDSYGWIAATIGWALWFLTLILLCICKVMDLRPDEPKYLRA